MFVRLFAQTQNSNEAKTILLDVIAALGEKVQSYSLGRIEPYWKIKGVTVVEAKIDLSKALNDDEYDKFFKSISDKWIFFGSPLEEALASRTTEGCNFLKKGIEMINIFF